MYRVSQSLESYVFRNADAVVTICEALREAIRPRVKSADRLFVVPNGVDTDKFDEALGAHHGSHNAWGLASKKVVAYVGTFQPYEGLDVLIRSMPGLIARQPDAHLLIVGGSVGEQDQIERTLKALADDIGVQHAVTFTGRLPHADVASVYQMAHVIAYPRILTRTTALTTPLKPLEAMAMGKAVVASDVPAMKELIVNGETGVLCRAGDVGSLVDSCAQLLASEGRRQELGGAAREWVRTERRWDRLVARYTEIYAGAGALTEPVGSLASSLSTI